MKELAPVPLVTCTLKISSVGPLTLEEVGMSMGLTRERIRQIAGRALAHLHRNMRLKNIVGVKLHDLPGE